MKQEFPEISYLNKEKKCWDYNNLKIIEKGSILSIEPFFISSQILTLYKLIKS